LAAQIQRTHIKRACYSIVGSLLAVLTAWSVAFSQNSAQSRNKSSAPDRLQAILQSVESTSLQRDLIRIRDAALADDYAYHQLAHLTENIGPRMSGSLQAEAAVRYVADELTKLGLEVKLEEVKVPHWVRGIESAELIEFPSRPPDVSQNVVVTALSGCVATPVQGIVAEVIVVRDFDELKNLGRANVTGKIVLFNRPLDTPKAASGYAVDAYVEGMAYRREGAKAAADLGAVASLIRSLGTSEYRIPHTGLSKPAGIPAGAVTSEDADLIDHLAHEGPVRMHLTLTPQRLPDVISHNVVADLKGKERPEQIVVVSGHLDSWDLGTGAIDDAAGVAMAMETVKVLRQLDLHPKRTIRVIAWMDEEIGGSGRQAYTAAHAKEFANHVGAIESDLGAAHPLGFDAKMNPAGLVLLLPVQDVLRDFGANLIKMTTVSPAADISDLADAGGPTFGIKQDGRTYFNYHHTAADTLDKVVPRELQENAAAMAVMGYALAEMAETVPR